MRLPYNKTSPESMSVPCLFLLQYQPGKITEERLLQACAEGDFSRARQLISQGADPKSTKDVYGWTPLHWACKEGNLSFIKTLVEKHSCDLESKTSVYYFFPPGSTPLHLACWYVTIDNIPTHDVTDVL